MGVQGLTSFVHKHSDLFFEDHRLKNCIVIIDGYGLASYLYNCSTKLNSSFGGDYDKYARLISNFFINLLKCNVTPIVVCDGGYEKKKISTVKYRNQQKIYTLERITPMSSDSLCFPLMMRHVFREKLLDMEITVLQSDFEADNEIAALAKKLDAPVISNDSDFFIFGVRYIPLSSLPLDEFKKDERGKLYIPCEILLPDHFLKGLGDLPKVMLPLLATLLGNDYISAGTFKNFYSHLKTDRCKTTRAGMKRVKALVPWLRNETFDTALQKILANVKRHLQKKVRRSINRIIRGYTDLNTPLDNYLPLEIKSQCQNLDKANVLADEFKKLSLIKEDVHVEVTEENDDLEVASSLSSLESVSDDEDGKNISDDEEEKESSAYLPGNSLFPQWFLDESRRANMCPTIATLISLQIFFDNPQVQDYTHPNAGLASQGILKAILRILGLESITYWSRYKRRYVGYLLEASAEDYLSDLPEYTVLNTLPENQRKTLIFKTLKIDKMEEMVFPEPWSLYIMSINYWLKKDEEPVIKPCHLHAVIMTLIVVNVIQIKVGGIWNKKTFRLRYGNKLKQLGKKGKSLLEKSESTSVEQAISMVSEDDCVSAMDFLIENFHVDESLTRRPQNFSRLTIHLFAQLQAIFELAVSLNSLLLMPFKRSNLSMFYNGTFLYNFTIKIKNKTDILSYIENIFVNQPSIFSLYKCIYGRLCNLTQYVPKQKPKFKKPKPRKQKFHYVEDTVKSESDENSDDFEDPNNKFAISKKLLQNC